MKTSILIFSLSFIVIVSLHPQKVGTILDHRDNQVYNIVLIGNQVWLSENLNFKPPSGNSWYFNNDSSNYSLYGKLYDYSTALESCPEGWSLPQSSDWLALVDTLQPHPGIEMKSTNYWLQTSMPGTNSSGFTGLPAGYRNHNGAFYDAGYHTMFWSKDIGTYGPYILELDRNSADAPLNQNIYQSSGFSVRCFKNYSELSSSISSTNVSYVGGDDGVIDLTIEGGLEPYKISWSNSVDSEDQYDLTAGIYKVEIKDAIGNTINDSVRIYDTFMDNRDGQTYTSILIGDQIWMAENLNVGLRIAGSSDQTDNSIVEKYAYMDNELACDTLGGLYQWKELMNYQYFESAQGICPDGWHVPSDNEWKKLELFLGMGIEEAGIEGIRGTTEGLVLKDDFNLGYNAKLGGYRLYVDGSFIHNSLSGYFWSSTFGDDQNAWMREVYSNREEINRDKRNTSNGKSVRCIKNNCNQEFVTGSIKGNINSRLGDIEVYSLENSLFSEYTWTIVGGSILSGQGSDSILVSWNDVSSGMVTVTEKTVDGCFSLPSSLNVNIIATHISIQNNDTIEIYPNPFSDYIIVKNPNALAKSYCISIYKYSGEVILFFPNINTPEFHVNTHTLKKGIYFIKIQDSSVLKTYLIVK